MTLNSGCVYRERIPKRAGGVTLLDWLSAEYVHSSRDEWRQRIAEGRVTLDGAAAASDAALGVGQELCWTRPPWVEPEVPLTFEVVHEDAQVLVVSKPSGLPTMPGGAFSENTLLTLVRARDAKWSAVHRLGRGTSGLVVFATPESAAAVSRAFAEREVEKRYLARVTGALEPQTITAPIGLVPHAKLGELHAVSERGRFAQSIVEKVDGSLATVRIVTGRPHQVRVHLAWVGHPLEGDPLYGPRGALLDALPSDLGYYLHAWQLAFRHPASGELLRLTAHPERSA